MKLYCNSKLCLKVAFGLASNISYAIWPYAEKRNQNPTKPSHFWTTCVLNVIDCFYILLADFLLLVAWSDANLGSTKEI